jgi:hypothetical protein
MRPPVGTFALRAIQRPRCISVIVMFFRAHHHRDATSERVGRKLVYGVTSCGTSFWANNVVFELRTIGY